MDDVFAITEEPIPIPNTVKDVVLRDEIVLLHKRCAQLEKELETERRAAYRTTQRLLLDMLEVADALQRILAHSSLHVATQADGTNQAFIQQEKNLSATARLLTRQLEKVGVRQLALVGTVLDPAVADVEDARDDPTLPDETILEEIISGYVWGQDILRRAKVVVSQR